MHHVTHSARSGMRVLETAVYRGPHPYGSRPMVRLRIDLGELEQWPSDRLPGFAERLSELLPGLATHGCSLARPGGFLERLAAGTWLGYQVTVIMDTQRMVIIDWPMSIVFGACTFGLALMTLRAIQVAVRNWRSGTSPLMAVHDEGRHQ